MKTLIFFVFFFVCFQRVGGPKWAPNGSLEALLPHLGSYLHSGWKKRRKLSEICCRSGGSGVLWVPIRLSRASFCSPGEPKTNPAVLKRRCRGHRENSDFPRVFACFGGFGGPEWAPNGGLEALRGPTRSSWGALLENLTYL